MQRQKRNNFCFTFPVEAQIIVFARYIATKQYHEALCVFLLLLCDRSFFKMVRWTVCFVLSLLHRQNRDKTGADSRISCLFTFITGVSGSK